MARAVAYNVAVLCSVTTLFFNANPLLRYDGYYILADLIEIPNLGSRANKYWQYLTERFVFGVRNAQAPLATPGERRWFVGYAPLSYVYRLFVSISIALFIAQQFFVVGVLIGLWTVLSGMFWPIFKGLRALFTGAQFADRVARVRGVLLARRGGAAAAAVRAAAAVPHQRRRRAVAARARDPARAEPRLRAPAAGRARRPAGQRPAGAGQRRARTGGAHRGAARARSKKSACSTLAAWSSSPARAQLTEQELAREQAALAAPAERGRAA